MSSRREALKALEENVRQLDPSPEVFQHQIRDLEAFCQEFLHTAPHSDAALSVTKTRPIDAALPSQPGDFLSILKEFSTEVLPYGFNPTSGGFFGYVPGGGLPSAALGDFLAAFTNRYAGVYLASPGAAEIENLCVRWLCDLVGYPAQAWGTLLSGGTLATLTCVVAARERREQRDWEHSVVYLSPEVHNAVHKSLKTAGLGHLPCRALALDDDLRIRPSDLVAQVSADQRRGLKPWIVFCSAGTVNTGAIDPIADLATICESSGLWLHVDGAYGGCFAYSNARSSLLGIERADSVVLDPHKGMFLPYGCGAALVRKGGHLRHAFAASAAYLEDIQAPEYSSPSDYSPELTRHFRGLRLWLSLKLHGVQRFKDALNEKLLLAEEVYEGLGRIPGLVLGPKPQLTIVTYRAESGDQATKDHLQGLLASRRVHMSTTRLNGMLYIRICVLSFRSHLSHVDELLDLIRDNSPR